MDWKKLFRRKDVQPVPPDPRIAELEAQVVGLQSRIQSETHILKPVGGVNLQEVAGIRRGSWVVIDGKTGILHGITPKGCEVHFTNVDGHTIGVQYGISPDSNRMATLNELPWERLDRGRTHDEAVTHLTSLGHKGT